MADYLGSPTIPVHMSMTTNWTNTFPRLMQGVINDTEELRRDVPQSFLNGFEYLAIAPAGANTADLVWKCIRCTWLENKKIRFQYRSNIAWDNRTIGW